MQWADLGAGRRFLELFLRLVDDGTLDEIRGPIAVNSEFWSLVFPVTERQPGWACEIIGHYFTRRLELSLAGGQANPFDSDRGTLRDAQLAGDIFLRAARGAPQEFIVEVFPFMLRVMDLTAERAAEPPWPDPVWRYRFSGGGYGLAEQLLVAMETALVALAQSAPDKLRPILCRLLGLEFETAHYLAVRAYTASGERFAEEAVDYILARPLGLETGYLDSSRWAARQLVEAVTPHCSADRLVRLEEILLEYYPRWERSVEGRRAHGYAQLVLLEGVAPARRSERVTRRIGELRRKFGPDAVQAPTRRGFERIRPPIPEAAADKMSDDQWLSAIARYGQDRETFREGHFTGGALELSRLLESQVKKEPRRFADLVCRFPDDTHSHYFDAVLRGIGDSGLDAETVLTVCRRCHGLRGRPCGRWITRPIARLAASALPEEALEIVTWYATEDKDPEEETWRVESPGGKPYYGGDILTAAINSVRGAATEAIAELIFHDPTRLTSLRPALERLARDPSVSVRCCLASALTAALRYDRDLAVRLFLMASDIDEDRLFATHYVERFLAYALRTHFRALLPVVERMRSSNVAEVATAGSRRLCAASLVIEDAIPLARTCLSGSDQQRLGAAQVFAANLREAAFRSFSEEALITLFNERSEEVRGEAAHCFRGLEAVGLVEYDNLVAKFARSRAFANAPYHLIDALIEDTGPLPEATCFVCERFIEVFAGEARTIQTRAGGEAGRVSQLIVRVYTQSRDQVVQGRCLDLMDRMAAAGILGFDEALVQYER